MILKLVNTLAASMGSQNGWETDTIGEQERTTTTSTNYRNVTKSAPEALLSSHKPQ